MLNSAIFDLMMKRLGNRQASLIRLACVTEINESIRNLERGPIKPWFLEDTVEDTMVAEQGYIDHPDDFLQEVEEGVFEILTTEDKWIEIPKVTRDKLRTETKNCDPAFPEAYAIWGNTFLLGPTPDLAYEYRFDYLKRTGDIEDNNSEATNPWVVEFSSLIIYDALVRVARDHIQSDRMATNFTLERKQAWDSFMREVEARRVTNETLLLTDEES